MHVFESFQFVAKMNSKQNTFGCTVLFWFLKKVSIFDQGPVSPCTFNASRVHSYPYLKRPIWAQITRDTTLMLSANSLAKSMSSQPDGGNAESKQLMFKVGWKYPLRHRLNDTIALHRALRQQPPPYPPLARTHSPSPSQPPFLHFWNPLCGISNVFFIRLLQAI